MYYLYKLAKWPIFRCLCGFHTHKWCCVVIFTKLNRPKKSMVSTYFIDFIDSFQYFTVLISIHILDLYLILNSYSAFYFFFFLFWLLRRFGSRIAVPNVENMKIKCIKVRTTNFFTYLCFEFY